MISIKSARRAGVPLIAIETADPQQSIANIIADFNGKAAEIPVLRWDLSRGLAGINEIGGKVALEINENPATLTNPAECLGLFATEKMPENSIIFFLNAHRCWADGSVMQGIWNLRDIFKSIGATLVLFTPLGTTLPDELKSDCITLTDSLPTEAEIIVIVDGILKDFEKEAKFDVKKISDKDKIVDTLSGLSAFSAEQVLAMSLTKEGIDRSGLWERKRKMIEQTPGLSVWRGGETFKDIGGYDNAKKFMRDICTGRGAPRSIVFIDEIEKSMAGSQSDSSGVSQDYLRCLLTWMQDKEAGGSIFIGPPGSGKSAIAKATGNEANIPTIALDLGGMKGSLVGESERRLRSALQVVEAVSQGSALFIATCNSIGILPPELRRRFSLGTFFFPLPSKDDRKKIWEIYLKKYKLNDTKFPSDEGWTGAEIKNCASIAWRLKTNLIEASKFVVPVSVSAKDQIDRLCREAHQRYISASVPGPYSYDKMQIEPVAASGSRRMNTGD